jgi:phenolic acid decarboxylase
MRVDLMNRIHHRGSTVNLKSKDHSELEMEAEKHATLDYRIAGGSVVKHWPRNEKEEVKDKRKSRFNE